MNIKFKYGVVIWYKVLMSKIMKIASKFNPCSGRDFNPANLEREAITSNIWQLAGSSLQIICVHF